MKCLVGVVVALLFCAGCSLVDPDAEQLSGADYEHATTLITPGLLAQCEKGARGMFGGAALKIQGDSTTMFQRTEYAKKISSSHAIHLSSRASITSPSGSEIAGNLVCRFSYNKASDSIAFSGVFFE